ncbi:MAG: SDR family NAD(P)-dependent oxidoreductase [Anaerolineaceae bacterium]|nr:SDR family NAD(P)-dependent oxidoreductase [Anaerolineaceae bacterium]
MDGHFKDKVAVITGASSGIGRQIALEFARRGARVALAARSENALKELQNEIETFGGQALAAPTDSTDSTQVKHFFQQVINYWGQVDLLVVNAGQYIRSPIDSITLTSLQESMAVNFYGGVHCILAALPAMRARGSGQIIVISTMDVKTPLALDAPYVAAKSALSGFADVLRQELHGSGIRVSIIYPGRVNTPMLDTLKVPAISAKMPSSSVAAAVVRAVRSGRARFILPFQANILYWLYLISPTLADWAALKFHLQGWETKELK